MLYDWFVLGDTEIANNARTLTYARAGRASNRITFAEFPCPTLAAVLGETYTLPETDGAPWYDPSITESSAFAGLLLTQVDGMETSPANRASIDRVTEGAAFSRQRLTGRPMVFTGFLLAATDSGLEYGYRWLTEALGGLCTQSVSGEDLSFLASCPECDVTPPNPTIDIDPILRTMRQVALISGPHITERHSQGCGCCGGCTLARVEFTLTAGLPWIYGETMAVADDITLTDGTEQTVTFRSVEHGTYCGCDDPACGGDSLCPVPAVPPRLPAFQNPCACMPLHAYRKDLAVSRSTTGLWFDMVPSLALQAGTTDLRNLVIRFIPNPTALDCDDSALDVECLATEEILISQVPAGETLVIDGPSRLITLHCGGTAPSDGSDRVFSGTRPYRFPVLSCSDYCIRVEADPLYTAANAALSLDLVRRQL